VARGGWTHRRQRPHQGRHTRNAPYPQWGAPGGAFPLPAGRPRGLADAQGHREDSAVTRARKTLTECERKFAKHLDGLEAGIPADVIAARIAGTQREKSAAESVLATARPAPAPLTLEQVMEALTALRDLPELLGRIEQADRVALYQALDLTVHYRRNGSAEEIKLTSTLRSVDLEHVGASERSKNSQVNG
jgi:hypothetical protein